MCGIHGGLALGPGVDLDAELLKRMGKATIHRGPDDEGLFLDEGVAMGMRRLSIIDLAGGHQPLFSEDKTVVLVCNGEIYNYRKIRSDLISKGYKFSTHSDSEVILPLYQEYGENFLDHLNGMFAFALWDTKKQLLIIGRDRLGVKPLYYHLSDDLLLFSTEAKALFEYKGLKPALDHESVYQYVQLGYVPAPKSMYCGVSKLPVASCIRVEKGKVSIHEYWRPDFEQTQMNQKEWETKVFEQLQSSVSAQMVSDVPVGAFLSGGIDSSLVVGLMSRFSSSPVKTYSIGFDTAGAGEFYNELPYAKQVAELFSTEHKEIVVKPNVVSLLPKLIWHMDEPIADTAFITTYLVSEFARKDVTVILSGVGGDELFGGYRRYQGEYYLRFYQKIPRWIRQKILLPLANRLPSDRHSALMNYSRLAKKFILSAEDTFENRYRSYMELTDKNTRSRLLVERSGESATDPILSAFGTNTLSPINAMFEVDRKTQLPDDLLMLTDKMTMATSLECRVPLLDHELVELSCRMPDDLKIKGGTLKYILKESLTELLPEEILHRKKRGFGAPMGAWIKSELLPLMNSLLSSEVIRQRGVFNAEVVSELLEDHLNSRQDNTDILIGLMNFEIWSRLMLDGASVSQVEQDLLGMIQ